MDKKQHLFFVDLEFVYLLLINFPFLIYDETLMN